MSVTPEDLDTLISEKEKEQGINSGASPMQSKEDSLKAIDDAIVGQGGTIEEDAEMEDYGVLGNALFETSSAVTRGATDMVDFLYTKPVNALQDLLDRPESERYELMTDRLSPATTGGYMEDGIVKDALRTGGEFVAGGTAGGGAIRNVANMLPKIGTSAEPLALSIMRQMRSGKSKFNTVMADAGFGFGAGVGTEFGGEAGEWAGGATGKEIGKAVGGLGLPIIGGALAKPAVDLTKGVTNWVTNFFKNAPKPVTTNDEIMSEFMYEAFIREGGNPEDLIKYFRESGDQAIPADIGDNFANLLRNVANKVPRIQGEAVDTFKGRQAGTGERLLTAVDEGTGTGKVTLDDEIARIDTEMKPKISALYEQAGEEGMQLSPTLKSWFTSTSPTGAKLPKNSVGKVQKQVEETLANKRSSGQSVTNIDRIDATKRAMDDKINALIRQGKMNKAVDMIDMKNRMVAEADAQIPVYAEARAMHAGKLALESASQVGQQFFKMTPRMMKKVTESFSPSEIRMFKLGAKEAILDSIDGSQTTADMVKKIFGKGGQLKKMQYLFDTPESFKQFGDVMEREVRFRGTMQEVLGNSTTIKQNESSKTWSDVYKDISRAISNPTDGIHFVNKLMAKYNNKGTEEEQYVDTLEKIGYLLLEQGSDGKEIMRLFNMKNTSELRKRLEKAVTQFKPKFLQKNSSASTYPAVSTDVGIIENED